MFWTEELFGVKKPIIAMCHLQPMPGDPYYDQEGGMEKVVECARHDLLALQNGGVDGVMFSNEFSLPYLTKVRPETVAAMALSLIHIFHVWGTVTFSAGFPLKLKSQEPFRG